MIHQLEAIATTPRYTQYRCRVCCRAFRVMAGTNPSIPEDCGEEALPLPESPRQPAGEPTDNRVPPNGVATQAEQKRRMKICSDCSDLDTCLPTPCAKRKAIETGACPLGKWDAPRRKPLPASGLISPADQWCIQIEITNACAKGCSNCTRHCPHIAEPYYMDVETFAQAVRSMAGYDGMLGIQGGEPTQHPHFAELLAAYDRLWEPGRGKLDWGRQSIADFGAYHGDRLANTNHRRGLWSGLGPGYYRHFEAIQETFPYQCLNDHRNPAKHAPLLVTRKELGIDDATWIGYRDRCWVQRSWSSSITPKGCFPCEIMASLDMLYDGPGGWPIEPGWWKRQPADFGAMLEWCEQCGACLPLPEREAREGVHDVSLHHLEALWRAGSPAVKAGAYKVFDAAAWKPAEVRQDGDRYMPPEFRRKRVSQSNRSIKPRHLEGIVVAVGPACGAQLARVLDRNATHFDRLVVVASTADEETHALALGTDGPIELVVSDDCFAGGDAFNKGRMLNHGLAALRLGDWILNIDADILLPAGFRERLLDLVLNPGCLYYTRRRDLLDDDTLGTHGGVNNDYAPWGYFQLWHPRATALRGLPVLRYPDCFVSAGNVDTWWQLHWPAGKKISLISDDSDLSWDVGHVPHGPLASRWNGSHDGRGWRYVGQNNIRPDVPAIEKTAGGFLRIVRVDDCFSGVVPVESIQWERPHTNRIYEYQWRQDYYDNVTTWRAFFDEAAR